MWTLLCNLYQNKELPGVWKLKASTAKANNKVEKSSEEGVIIVYCGPYNDEQKVTNVGNLLVKNLDYASRMGCISYKLDVDHGQYKRIDTIYRINVPLA
jgi:hypothetical protein